MTVGTVEIIQGLLLAFAVLVILVNLLADVAYAFQRLNTKPLVAEYGFYFFGVVEGMTGSAPAPTPISAVHWRTSCIRSRAARSPWTPMRPGRPCRR